MFSSAFILSRDHPLQLTRLNTTHVTIPIASCDSDAEAKMHRAQSKVTLLADEREALSQALGHEKEASTSSRKEAARLQKELTELQVVATVAATQATGERVSMVTNGKRGTCSIHEGVGSHSLSCRGNPGTDRLSS